VQVGDLVQVLPAKIGYYIVISRSSNRIWNLAPVCEVNFNTGGDMNEKYIKVVSESR